MYRLSNEAYELVMQLLNSEYFIQSGHEDRQEHIGTVMEEVKKLNPDKQDWCPRCIETYDDIETGNRCVGTEVESDCDDCGVCFECEHMSDCPTLD
jgi:hypothetical protein